MANHSVNSAFSAPKKIEAVPSLQWKALAEDQETQQDSGNDVAGANPYCFFRPVTQTLPFYGYSMVCFIPTHPISFQELPPHGYGPVWAPLHEETQCSTKGVVWGELHVGGRDSGWFRFHDIYLDLCNFPYDLRKNVEYD